MASFVNGCVFTATSAGTGSFVVASAVTGWQTPAQAGATNAATYRYRAYSSNNTEWEIGSGVYTTGTVTLTRAVIEASSNAGAAVNFTAAPAVALTMFDEDFLNSANVTGTGNAVLANTPTLVTPVLGAATGTTIVLTGADTAASFIPSSNTVPTDGMYLPAASTLGWAVSSTAEMQLTSTALSPAADGGSSLGTTALGWQNLFGNTAFVINIENGNWVATHTSAILTVGTGDLRVTTAGTNTASAVTVGGTQTLTAKTLTDPVITGTILEDVFTITDAAAFEIDPGNGSIQLITLTASRTPAATNFAAGESVTLMIADGTAYTITWSTVGVVWVGGSAPTLATTGYTVVELWKVASTIYGARVGDVA